MGKHVFTDQRNNFDDLRFVLSFSSAVVSRTGMDQSNAGHSLGS